MIFGNECPFHLKPIPYRGLRKHEAEEVMHYPGYRHPLEPPTLCSAPLPHINNQTSTAAAASSHSRPPQHNTVREFNPDYNITETHRLCRELTVEDDLRHERQVQRAIQQERLQARQERRCHADWERERKRENAFQAEVSRAAAIAGTDRTNRDSEDRDVITHCCRTQRAQEAKDYHDAMGRHSYHLRQRRADHRNHLSGFNVITWEQRPEIYVPPRPEMPTFMQEGSEEQ